MVSINTEQFLQLAPQNAIIQKTIMTMAQKLDFDGRCLVAVSGGSDSDILIDLVEKSQKRCQIIYVFFDTGLEYQATHEHLNYLEEHYGITIIRFRPKYPIPAAVRKYGVPLFSKKESEYIGRLQKHGLDFSSTSSFESHLAKHPKATSALRWWHNLWGEKSSFNISQRKGLREFLQLHPPSFRISTMCCQKAKKEPAYHADKLYSPDLKINGVRREEGGARAYAFQNCFTPANKYGIAEYRPLFFWTDEDKLSYDSCFNVRHSRCYSEYGLKRTGCAGCPFSSHFEEELETIQKYEPKLFKAVIAVFGQGYDYFRSYREYRKTMR